ncbi:MAG TPA: HNH endonuclease [Polyangiales bacterium]|nr:HNH endonuclease [Polyangiales bacterium]
MIERTCQNCESAFRVKACEVKRGGGLYCSVRCRQAASRKGSLKACEACGEPFYAQRSRAKYGKGRFCSKACGSRGDNNANWLGGRKIVNGYVFLHSPNHPHADEKGYVEEHRLVAERVHKLLLPREAVVHHLNEIRSDNRPSNLVICPNQAYHIAIHNRMRRIAALRAVGGDPAVHQLCVRCETPKAFSEFHRTKHGPNGFASTCKACARVRSADKYQRLKNQRKAS